MSTRAVYKGFTFDERTAAMLAEVDRLTPDIPVTIMQGSYSTGTAASAGTHAGGGAVDIAAADLTPQQRAQLLEVLRLVGFAAWIRTPDQGFAWHLHGIAVGCQDLSPEAAAQVADYAVGRNGLRLHGPDDGPRDHVGMTWERYRSTDPAPSSPTPAPPHQEEEDMALTEAQDSALQELVAIARTGRSDGRTGEDGWNHPFTPVAAIVNTLETIAARTNPETISNAVKTAVAQVAAPGVDVDALAASIVLELGKAAQA